MKRINSLVELKAEQKLLLHRKTFLEAEIKKGFVELKDDLEPLKLLTKGAGNALSSKNNGILGNSFGYLAEFLTKNVFLKNSGFFTRMVVPFLAKNTTSNIVENHKLEITNWIEDLISRFSGKKTADK